LAILRTVPVIFVQVKVWPILQFGFMAGKGTTDAMFIVRQLQEKYLAKKKGLWNGMNAEWLNADKTEFIWLGTR